MSEFEVMPQLLEIEPHPDADRLEVARVGDYRCVVGKRQFATGEWALYIPENAIVPHDLLKAMGLWDYEKDEGKLAGRYGDRVKAVRLRGVLSQGLVLGEEELRRSRGEGIYMLDHDYAEELGIRKYEPPVPREMSGKVYQVRGLTSYTEIENIKKHPAVLEPDELVVATEKLHGTCSIFSMIYDEDGEPSFHVSSKGLAKRGQAIVSAPDNVYWRMFRELHVERAFRVFEKDLEPESELTIFAETVGTQDLMYGLEKGTLDARVFDIRVDGRYLGFDMIEYLCSNIWGGMPMVPTLYEGPFGQDVVDAFTSGMTVLSTGSVHLREGIVIRPVPERIDRTMGRVILKSVSDDYLTRRNPTEME